MFPFATDHHLDGARPSKNFQPFNLKGVIINERGGSEIEGGAGAIGEEEAAGVIVGVGWEESETSSASSPLLSWPHEQS